MAASTEQVDNLVSMIDGYAEKGGHHLNINVFNRDTLLDAQAHPEKYPQLTIRVSGYAVKFTTLTKQTGRRYFSYVPRSSLISLNKRCFCGSSNQHKQDSEPARGSWAGSLSRDHGYRRWPWYSYGCFLSRMPI